MLGRYMHSITRRPDYNRSLARLTDRPGRFEPLAPDRMGELVEQIQNGSVTARNELVCHNLRLVAHLLKRSPGLVDRALGARVEMDDLIQEGALGMIRKSTRL